ncbi:Hypp1590 [Branchiostoma lanceolatum]|uniref:Hypp1590 protein n=1 Tax=Branchiostoma lanceolatum TaxID=7740 RepID=A0A8J9ZJB4_BRALA|nr:Hypp1590 [Branchiostoma lanceolatum]
MNVTSFAVLLLALLGVPVSSRPRKSKSRPGAELARSVRGDVHPIFGLEMSQARPSIDRCTERYADGEEDGRARRYTRRELRRDGLNMVNVHAWFDLENHFVIFRVSKCHQLSFPVCYVTTTLDLGRDELTPDDGQWRELIGMFEQGKGPAEYFRGYDYNTGMAYLANHPKGHQMCQGTLLVYVFDLKRVMEHMDLLNKHPRLKTLYKPRKFHAPTPFEDDALRAFLKDQKSEKKKRSLNRKSRHARRRADRKHRRDIIRHGDDAIVSVDDISDDERTVTHAQDEFSGEMDYDVSAFAAPGEFGFAALSVRC